MNTIEDLRRSLHETAEQHEAPDPTTLLRAVREDIADDGRSGGGRRLLAAVAAVALIAGGGYALTQGLGDDEGLTEVPPAEQGWELVDGAPPEFAGGLELIATHEVDYAAGGEVEVTAPQQSGDHVFALAWCDVGPAVGSANVEPPTVQVTATAAGGATRELACAGRSGEPAPVGPLALPSQADDEAYAVSLTGDLPSGGTATLAFYGEATVQDYPFPDAGEVAVPQDHDAVIDATTPLAAQPDLYDLLGQATAPATTVESRPGTVLTTWAGEPGRLLVAVNGVVLTNDGEDLAPSLTPGPWEDADPDLRRGYWHVWNPGATAREFDLSPEGLAARGIEVQEGETVQVAALGNFARDAWQVGIDLPEGAPGTAGPEPIEPTEALPEYAYGLRQVTAVELPADGTAYPVDLGDVDPAEAIWVVDCGPETSATEMVSVRIATVTAHCAAGPGWFAPAHVPDLPAGSPVPVTAGVGDAPVSVAAYLPQDWEDYPFESAPTPLHDGEQLDWMTTQPQDGEPLPEFAETHGERVLYREVGRIGPQDLDDAGRAELTVPSSADLSVWIQTQGQARVRVDVGGEDLFERLGTAGAPGPELYLVRDGWFSTWSPQPAGYEVREWGSGIQTGNEPRDEPTVTIEVDAADDAGAELVFYELVPESAD